MVLKRLLERAKKLVSRGSAYWVRRWYTVSSIKGDFEYYLGDTYAPFEFDDVWGLGEVAFGIKDKIGFTSELTVQALDETAVSVEYGCDDGARFFVYDSSGNLIYSKTDSWRIQPYTKYRAYFVLKKGVYKFVFEFYEWTAYARASFKVLSGKIRPIKI
ncbi:MAG: hypothetical protein DRJ68_00870 [Thermoprotei archaeon]|nr:MAG: hypothetical protein DRJ62_02625 [Thermoprotei archaeon]RLF22834.1 MAG: hypothetical protein DRJ68_00870 [Thermoprotei archaeon]